MDVNIASHIYITLIVKGFGMITLCTRNNTAQHIAEYSTWEPSINEIPITIFSQILEALRVESRTSTLRFASSPAGRSKVLFI